jgi:hypothetical protein
LPPGEWKSAGYESRQVFNLVIKRQVTEYRAKWLENEHGEYITAEFPEEHLEALVKIETGFEKQKTIVIFDRGYPCKDFIKYLQDKEIKYVMRVQNHFNAQIDGLKTESKIVQLGEGALALTLIGGEREALITNLDEGEMEDAAFPVLYYKRWPIETKYCQLKQNMELENFSGMLVDTIKQDFYAMMTVSTMLASCMREANSKIKEEGTGKETRYEYKVNGNHAIGVLKDRLVGIQITDDGITRNYLYRELVSEMKRRLIPLGPNREVPRKEYLKKPHFHHNHKSNC